MATANAPSSALKQSIARLGNKLSDHKKDATFAIVPIDACTRYSRQTRTVFAEGPLQELAASIKENGILEPLLVRPLGNGKYEIIAGERRMRAARIAGLQTLPVLYREMSDELAYKIHLAENIHRENLTTLELAQSVQRDVDAANGVLEKAAEQYSKSKSWISKMCAIAQGGGNMTALVDEGVTADRAVLAVVSSLERKAPGMAEALAEQLRSAPAKVNKRHLAEGFMKAEKVTRTKNTAVSGKGATTGKKSEKSPTIASEPTWRTKATIARSDDEAKTLITVELSPLSLYAAEFAELSRKFGKARLVMTERHPDSAYAIVQFGNTEVHRRVYQADELRLLSVH